MRGEGVKKGRVHVVSDDGDDGGEKRLNGGAGKAGRKGIFGRRSKAIRGKAKKKGGG